MLTKLKTYLLNRLNEFSTYIAIGLLLVAVLLLPKGLTAFIIAVLAIVLMAAPDTRFSALIRKYFL